MRRLVLVCALLPCVLGADSADEPLVLRGDGWIGAVAFSPDNNYLAVGTANGTVFYKDLVHENEGGGPGAGQRFHSEVSTLAWSPDGKVLAIGDQEGIIFLGPYTGYRTPRILKANSAAVLSSVFVDDKTLLTGSIDGAIRSWTIAAQTQMKPPQTPIQHLSWVNGLGLNAKKTLLASASSDNTVQVHRLADFTTIEKFTVQEGEVRSVAISPDDRFLAAGIRYGWVRVWDRSTKKEVATMKAHAGETWAVAFTPDGKSLASGGGDWNKPGEVRLYDTATWKERKTLAHSGEVLCLAISPNGRMLAAGAWDRKVRVWRIDAE
jgi:WD40 repeat protein